MRTTLDIDEKLLAELLEATGETSRGKAVDRAMEAYLKRVAIDRLLQARGKFPEMVDRTAEWEDEEIRLENGRRELGTR